jgi:hypothetical protein
MERIDINQLPRVGGIATMPSRAHTLPTALASILPQVDRLYVFFDKLAAVPDGFVNQPKIVPLLPAQHGNVAGSGKFLGAALNPDPCLYFCFDDDLLYPPNYVEVLARALGRNYLRALVGVHGAFFQPPYRSYRTDRKIFHFSGALVIDCHADLLGTGTMAFYSGSFRADVRSWPHHDMDDLMVAIEAVKQGLPRVLIRRPQGFLRQLEATQTDSLYQQMTRDDSRHSKIMREALEAYPLLWHRWGDDAI